MIRRGIAAGLAALVVTGVAGAAGAGPAEAVVGSSAAVRPVSFVPLGTFPRSDAAALARYFGRTLGLETDVLPRAAIPRSTFDPARKQFVAEELIDVVAGRRTTGNSQAVLIGLTVEDMYTRDIPSWRFTFSIRHPSGLAVVSRARMDPRLLGLVPDPALRMRRLQKMVLKNIGVLAFGLSQSRNPRSVLYDSILSGDDLDYMTQEFRPGAPSRAKQSWLGRANDVCERGISGGKALIARSPVATRADFLAFLRESIALEERSQVQLAAIAAPPEDRPAVRAMLARFKRVVGVDRAAIAQLSARWSEETLKRWLQEGVRFSLALKSNALELGSRSCGRYFDPATYAR